MTPGEVIDLYDWTRAVALRVAMRALFGIDPDRAKAGGLNAAAEFESALSFYGREYMWQILRGPRSPFDRLMASRRRLDSLIYGEIDRRRASGERGEDILSLLLDAADEEGETLSRRHIRDEVMTLLFAGHDTTTSTVAFMFYELARNPAIADDPTISVEMIIDETLRKYPPAYIGPRRSVEAFEFAGATVPARRTRPLLLVGQPSSAGRVARAGGVPPAAVHRGEQGQAAAGRLRAVRRRLAHVHRDAVRPGGAGRDRPQDPRAVPARDRCPDTS